MKVLLDYFGLSIFAFVVFVGGLVALPEVTEAPQTSLPEALGLALAFVVIAGGFSWYYFTASPEKLDGGNESVSRDRSF